MADVAEVAAQNGKKNEEVASPTKSVEKNEEVASPTKSLEKNKEVASPTKSVEKTDTTESEENENVDEATDGESSKKEVVMTPELERKIIRQMEFYFGDLNLARDRFMQGEIKENDGWLTMETMLKFNRLKKLCADADKIVEATKKSSSGLLEFSEDGKKVRRSTAKPVPSNTEERRADLKSRTCYAKNIPTNFTMSELLDFFDKHCSTELIQMRRTAKKEFKGSVFVVFPTKEEAQKFLDLKELKVTEDAEPLVKMLKEDYFQTKVDDKKKGKGKADDGQDKEKKEAAMQEEEKLLREKMTKGAILHLVGVSGETTREDLKAAFGGEDSKIAWVDHDKGDSDAWLRFDEENGAKTAWESHSENDKMMIKDAEVRADVLDGEVEFNHWKNIFQSRADRGRRGGRGGGRGGWRGGRGRGRGGKGRRGGRDNDGPASKRARRD